MNPEKTVAEMQEELAAMPVEAAPLPRDLVLLKMENEQMMTSAAMRPRNLVAIAKDLKDQLKAFPLLAAECIFNKPVGKDREGKQKFARGLSIRAAEMIAEAYAYNRVALSSEPIAPGSEEMRLTAVFIDYQKCRMWQASITISPWYKDYSGKMVKMPQDRFQDLKVKAELSKLGREAILRCVSTALKIEIEDYAERCLVEALPDDFAAKSIQVWGAKKVTLEMLEALIGKPAPAWSKQDGMLLTTLWKAVLDEETTIAQIFADVRAPEPETGPVTATAFNAPAPPPPTAAAPPAPAPTPFVTPAPAPTAPTTDNPSARRRRI